ncbi:zinc finger protein 568-like [Seriola aureovittata]|uniref:zinc finger protein 568-like n=1 Tax=Seriola aureovittata TaxID=2871759 RepID=UPI0024BE8486|nr:zinc finger protein 568-like [Seriola aureovittata]
MSKVQMLRALVNQRLTAAAEEIFGLFERTIAEYEEEIGRQRRLLQEAVKTHNNTGVFPTNVKKVTVIKEVTPGQDQWSTSLDQEDPDPSLIKEEEDQLRTNQVEKQLQGLEEANTKFPLSSSSSLPVNSENDDDEGKAQSSRFDQSQTEENREVEHLQTEAGGGSEPDRHLQPDNETPIFSETEDSIKPQLKGLNALKNSASHVGYNAVNKSVDCSECGERLNGKDHLQIHMKCHTGEKTFACPFCGKKFTKKSNLTTHLRVHTGEKPFTCSVCNTSFSLRCTLVNHMRVHTGEKPFSCSVCSKRFSKKANLTTHMALHTEEKPFKCSSCDKRFTWHSQVRNHKCAVDGSR